MSLRYTHDCSNCHYLGQYLNYDLYFCPNNDDNTTIVCRYGDSVGDYNSGLDISFTKILKEMKNETCDSNYDKYDVALKLAYKNEKFKIEINKYIEKYTSYLTKTEKDYLIGVLNKS